MLYKGNEEWKSSTQLIYRGVIMISTGKIVQVIGPVVDIEFPAGQLPDIYHAITVKDKAQNIDLTMEAAQHLGNNLVRCVAMSSTDGLQRGMVAENTETYHCTCRERNSGPHV